LRRKIKSRKRTRKIRKVRIKKRKIREL